ncbi:MAG: hypothetical protein J0M15_15605 [Deltaproteobacteria bacterium]|jgi:hypothetical protein|nr:hypothetical protein [Deltaproteobacteria bacterium]
MKALSFISIAMFLIIWAPSMSSAAAAQDREVIVGINEAFIPGGFDIYSETYVVASGIFPNGCYKWSRVDVKHVDKFNHEIRSVANVRQGMCIMVLIPFNKEVKLGKFDAGQHTLRFVNGDGTYLEKTMVVEE